MFPDWPKPMDPVDKSIKGMREYKKPTGDRYHQMDPQSYAALWGSAFGDGPLFYNVSSASVAELKWTKAQWIEFVAAIDRLITTVSGYPSKYCPLHDAVDLGKLKAWANGQARKAKQ